MNATRAATIRLRSSFDGAVSLGRVQTPTLAIIARREEEIRAFKPEKYWLVDAAFEAEGARRYEGRFHAGAQPRLKSADEADAIVAAVRGVRGEITKLDKTKRKERPPLLYDLTSLQREANTRYGFSARRTLGAAQRCYEEHKALTYPRTSSRYLTSDMVPEFKEIAGRVGRRPEYREAACLRAVAGPAAARPRGRRRQGRRPPRDHPHQLRPRAREDERRRPPGLRPGGAALPRRLPPRGRVREHPRGDHGRLHIFRTRGKVLLVPGWRGVYGELSEGDGAGDEDEGRDQQLPRLERGEAVDTRKAEALEKETKPPRRYSDASLLGAMETAGKLVDDEEMREAMKESGIGTPATRAAIIERLIDVGYVERDARALVATEKGINVVRLLGEHPLTSPALTGDWEHRLAAIEDGAGEAREVHGGHRQVRRRDRGRAGHDAEGRPHPAREPGAVPGVRQRHRREPQGLLVLVARGPGLRLRDLEEQGGQAAAGGRRARAHRAPASRRRPVTGFKGRSGRSFRAKLALEQGADEDARWRVEFDEPWAKEGAKPPETAEAAETADETVAAAGADAGAAAA